MKHGLNTDTVTARREPRPTGRAKLLLSPISGPLPHYVLHPWPQSLSEVILYGPFPLLVAAEVTRRILPSNRIRLVTSSATVLAPTPESTLLRKLNRSKRSGCFNNRPVRGPGLQGFRTL